MTAQPPAMTQDGFHPDFADLAERIAAQRVGAYADSFSPHRIFAMNAIAHIWRVAADGIALQRRFISLTRDEALDELAVTIETALHRSRLRPGDALRERQLAQLTAMRWWHAQYRPIAYVHNMALGLRYDALNPDKFLAAANRRAA